MTSISPDVMSRVAAYQPDVVILSVAGSDLANPGAVTASLQMLMMELLALGVREVAVCRQVRRRNWQNFSYAVGSARVQQVNKSVVTFCQRTEEVLCWSLGGINVFGIARGTFFITMGPLLRHRELS